MYSLHLRFASPSWFALSQSESRKCYCYCGPASWLCEGHRETNLEGSINLPHIFGNVGENQNTRRKPALWNNTNYNLGCKFRSVLLTELRVKALLAMFGSPLFKANSLSTNWTSAAISVIRLERTNCARFIPKGSSVHKCRTIHTWECMNVSVSETYEGGDTASAHGGLEVTLQLLLDGASGVEALPQQDDGVDEEEGGNAIDDVLKDLNAGHMETRVRLQVEQRLNLATC